MVTESGRALLGLQEYSPLSVNLKNLHYNNNSQQDLWTSPSRNDLQSFKSKRGERNEMSKKSNYGNQVNGDMGVIGKM